MDKLVRNNGKNHQNSQRLQKEFDLKRTIRDIHGSHHRMTMDERTRHGISSAIEIDSVGLT